MRGCRRFAVLVATCLMVVLWAQPAAAQAPWPLPQQDNSPNDRAIAVLRSTADVARHREAFAMLEEADKAGDLRAKANLGLGYLLGVGTPRDPMQGGRLLRAAADAGDPYAALAVATTLAGGYGNLFSDDSAKACRMFEKLFTTGAGPEAFYRYSELCGSDPNMQQNFAVLGNACRYAAHYKHRAALFSCGDPNIASINNLKAYKAGIDRVVGLKPWQHGTAYEASYMPLFFSDRDDFLIYTIKLLEHNTIAWKFDLRKYLVDRGFKLENW